MVECSNGNRVHISLIPLKCPIYVHYKNHCEYAITLLLWIEGHGWGLLANENIKVGEFVMEHSGEVITWTQERGSSLVFVSQGIKNSCIISLNAK
ncbi:unnamed protein product, partial [Vitis vinifera]|uniref:Uncharacterized protein n=1 Tax=Vitis vinifera TaxID=29760 RepID=D7TZB9_VITVI